ncbi:MAG: FAD:protein FMN transferase [Turicibacter sp.]|nr:FAD:protein FMN transferase [Turicibacter sp.]
MKRMKYLLLAFLLVLVGCQQKEVAPVDPVSENKFLLGTIINITLYDNPQQKIFDEIFDAIEEIETKMTINNAITSEIIEINRQAGQQAVKVSQETFDVIKAGLNYSELAQGKFDITVGALVKLWEIGFEDAHVPSASEIEESLTLINYRNVELNEEELTVKLTQPNMMIDLGGIAKGYAADVAASILSKYGNQQAIINLGGNVYAYGEKANKDTWNIGIQNPNSSRGEYLGIAKVKNKSIVTSGTYERYFEQDGIIYHHILDPQTGYPVENNVMSVTIIADSSMTADALSTTAFALGVEEGLKLIESLDDVEALYVTADKRLYASSGFLDCFELTDESFSIAN